MNVRCELHGNRSRLLLIAFILIAAAMMASRAKDFVLPKPQNAITYPAHDAHGNEHVTVAAVPYTGQKASIFKGKYEDHNILPIYVVITNDGDSAVELTNVEVQLVTADRRAKIRPATDNDIYRKMSRIERRGDEPSRNPLPIPVPRGGPKVGVKKDVENEVESAQFRARAVTPHSSEAGFMFFDVGGIRAPLAGAKLYLTGMRDGGGQDLMYFEIDLDKASGD